MLRRRNVWLTITVVAVSLAAWRGLQPRPARAAEPRAAMSPEEWRYFQTQAQHWRAFALKR